LEPLWSKSRAASPLFYSQFLSLPSLLGQLLEVQLEIQEIHYVQRYGFGWVRIKYRFL
jgi:hypothetical protein